MSETSKATLLITCLAREDEAFRKVLWIGDQTLLMLMAMPED